MSHYHLPHNHGQNIERVLERMPPPDGFQTTAATFQQLGDPSRLRILWLLCHSEECVCNIAAAFGISDLQERPTIEELAKEFLINTATLKNTFKGIYGQPIGTYMKEYRIKQAASLLRQTQATIAEIANKVGYENQSKFAAAFQNIMRITPAEYRKQNTKNL